MTENLRFETEKSVCYEDGCSKYGEYRKYGQYYLWSDAMDSAGVYSSNGKGCGYKVDCAPHYPVRGICPDGWHIPDTTALNELFFCCRRQINSRKTVEVFYGLGCNAYSLWKWQWF